MPTTNKQLQGQRNAVTPPKNFLIYHIKRNFYLTLKIKYFIYCLRRNKIRIEYVVFMVYRQSVWSLEETKFPLIMCIYYNKLFKPCSMVSFKHTGSASYASNSLFHTLR